jgi:hypothetical protein
MFIDWKEDAAPQRGKAEKEWRLKSFLKET